MSKTIGNLIEECINYKYSKEHYKILQETYKINLMEEYIQSQLYSMQESSLDDYYIESVEEDTLYKLFTEAEAQKESSWKRFRDGITKVLDYIRRVLIILMENTNKTLEVSRNILNKLNSATIDEESAKRIAQLCVDSLKKSMGFNPTEQQIFAKQLSFSLPGVDESKTKALLACALSTNEVMVNPIKIKDKEYGSVSFSNIVDLMYDYMDDLSLTTDQFVTKLQQIYSKDTETGLVIYVGSKENKDMIKKLGQLKEKLNESLKNPGVPVKEYYDFFDEAGYKKSGWNAPRVQKPNGEGTQVQPERQRRTGKPAANAGQPPKQNGTKKKTTENRPRVKQTATKTTEQPAAAPKETEAAPATNNSQAAPVAAKRNPETIAQIYGIFKEIVGVIIQVYSGYVKYRKLVLKGLITILNQDTQQASSNS